MSFESGVKGRGSDRWWERRWWLWRGDMRRMTWTRRTVNRMRLTEWSHAVAGKTVRRRCKFRSIGSLPVVVFVWESVDTAT